MPRLLEEIGRLREESFRLLREGSGLAPDLDRFDPHYEHLFLWPPQRREIVGAYRFGFTDAIVPRHDVHGLYTRTLFRYDARLIAQRSEEHTSELQSLMRISYAVFCLKTKK